MNTAICVTPFEDMGMTVYKNKIVIKLGGGLITDKSQYKVVHEDRIDLVCGVISKLIESNAKVILVHGAGSFGHLEAKKWNLATGYDEEIIEQQRLAVKNVRNDMIELNNHVLKGLKKFNISGISHPPSEWANDLGPKFKGDISILEIGNKDIIQVTFGDVVDVLDKREFGILSGDDLMVRICKEIPGISHCIFLLGDTEGLLTKPPNEKGSELIPLWSKEQEITGIHDSDQDVTGGIFLKAQSASDISQNIDNVWLIDGRKPERILELVETGNTIGTKVI
jgi:isopentenyl phosphate kinase